jgi:hypothetical protein
MARRWCGRAVIVASATLKCGLRRGSLRSFQVSRKTSMSSNDTTHHAAADTQDPVERIVPSMPIVLPVVGGVLMFLLAFIAVFMA